MVVFGAVMVFMGLVRLVTGGPKAGSRGMSWKPGEGFSTWLSGTSPERVGRVRLACAALIVLGVALTVVAINTHSR